MKSLLNALSCRIDADGVANDPDRMGVGDGDGGAEEALLGKPDDPGHFTVAVE